MSLASIQNEILQLNSRERAMLIDLLWESLDEARIKEIETKWAAESEERIDAYDRGELAAVDGPKALQELRSSLTASTLREEVSLIRGMLNQNDQAACKKASLRA